jgi:hypothetical protein
LGTRGPFCDCTQTVWNDPHIGGEHGFVEFVRVVDQEATLLVAPEKGHHKTTKLEAWRPMLEDIAGSNAWEWTVHSTAWAAEWAAGAQAPFLSGIVGAFKRLQHFPYKIVFIYGAFVWARRARNGPKRRFSFRQEHERRHPGQPADVPRPQDPLAVLRRRRGRPDPRRRQDAVERPDRLHHAAG